MKQQSPNLKNLLQTNRKRVAFTFVRGLTVGGIETWATNLALELQKRGYEPIALTHRTTEGERGTNIESMLKSADVPIAKLRKTLSYGLHEENISLVRQYLPATIIPENGSYPLYARIFRDYGPIGRIIGVCHSDDINYYRRLSFYEPMISRFVAVSTRCAKKLLKVLPEHRHQDVVVRPCPSTAPLITSREYSSPDKPIKIINAGRIDYHSKRLHDIFLTARELDKKGINFSIDIIGDGKDQRRLRSEHAALPIEVRRRINLIGVLAQEELYRKYREADVFLLPSSYEGTSIALQEAMASGCVAISSNVSGSEDLIKHRESGFLYEIGDIYAVTQIICMLANDRRQLKDLGSQAVKSIATMGQTSYADWFQDLINSVWGEPARHWQSSQYHIAPPSELSGLLKYFLYRYTPLYRAAHRFT